MKTHLLDAKGSTPSRRSLRLRGKSVPGDERCMAKERELFSFWGSGALHALQGLAKDF